MLKELIKLFIRTNGRNPNKLELLQLRFKAAQESGKGQILTPDFNKKKPWHITEKRADVIALDEPLINEFAGPPHGYGAGHGTADPTQAQRIRQGFSTQSKLNSWAQNQKQVSDFIGRKNAEFNFLNKDDQTKVLEMFEVQIKKHMPKEPKADGGVAGMLGERTGFQIGGPASPRWGLEAQLEATKALKNLGGGLGTLAAYTPPNPAGGYQPPVGPDSFQPGGLNSGISPNISNANFSFHDPNNPNPIFTPLSSGQSSTTMNTTDWNTAHGGAFKGLDMTGFKPTITHQQDMANFSINGNEVQGMNSAYTNSVQNFLN